MYKNIVANGKFRAIYANSCGGVLDICCSAHTTGNRTLCINWTCTFCTYFCNGYWCDNRVGSRSNVTVIHPFFDCDGLDGHGFVNRNGICVCCAVCWRRFAAINRVIDSGIWSFTGDGYTLGFVIGAAFRWDCGSFHSFQAYGVAVVGRSGTGCNCYGCKFNSFR